MSAAFNELATIISPQLAARLVQVGIWTQEQAFAYAGRARPQARLEVLVGALPGVADENRDELARAVLAAAQGVAGDVERVENVIVQLVEALPASFMPEVISLVRGLSAPRNRGKALEAAASRLPGSLVADALTLAKEVDDPEARAAALAAFVERLDGDEASQVLGIAVESARRAHDPGRVLAEMARRLPRQMAARLPEMAEPSPDLSAAVLGRLADDDPMRAFTELKSLRDSAERWFALEQTALGFARGGDAAEALSAVRVIPARRRAQALAHLTELVSGELGHAILIEVRRIPPEDRAEPLGALARLADAALAKAVSQAATRIRWPAYRLEALIEVAAGLPVDLADDAVRAAFGAATEDPDWGLDKLARIADRLPLSLAMHGLELAARSAEPGQLDAADGGTVGALAARVAELGDLTAATSAVVVMGDAARRAAALGVLAERLPLELLASAWRAIGPERSESGRLGLVTALASHLTPAVLERAALDAEAIAQPRERFDRLLAVASSLRPASQRLAIRLALNAVPDLDDGFPGTVVDALGEAMAQLCSDQMSLAVTAAGRVEDPAARLSALVAVANAAAEPVAEQAWRRALRDAFGLRVKEGRDRALAWLLPQVPRYLQEEVLDRAMRLGEDGRTRVLVAIAPDLEEPLRTTALERALALRSPRLRLKVLGQLVKGLEPQQRRDLVSSAFATLEEDPRAYKKGWLFQATVELASYDESPLNDRRAQLALSWALQRNDPAERIEALAMLAGGLPGSYGTAAMAHALSAASSIANSDFARAVRALALCLPPTDLAVVVELGEHRREPLRRDAAEAVKQRVDEVGREFIHVTARAGDAGSYDTAIAAASLIPDWLREDAIQPLILDLPPAALQRAAGLIGDTDVRCQIALQLGRQGNWPASLEVLEAPIKRYGYYPQAGWDDPGAPIAQLAEIAPRPAFPRLLAVVRSLSESAQAKALPVILGRLPLTDRRVELERALESSDTDLLAAIAPQAASLPKRTVLAAWTRLLREASRRGRTEVYRYVAALAPAITASQGDLTLAIYEAVEDVDRWWATGHTS
jgi:hypothetical protein